MTLPGVLLMLFRRGSLPGRALAAALGCLLLGCSGKDAWELRRPAVVPVTGRVLYRGQPLAGAAVTFMNPDSQVSGYGMTGDDGRFTLTTFKQGDGAAPGKQLVSVRKVEVIYRGKPAVDASATSEVPPAPEERWLIPSRYGSYETSKLTAEVREGAKNEFVLELQD
jgi:hypothetical protein